MMEKDVAFQEVISAVNALSNPSHTHQANQWLTNFQSSTLAWEIAEALLKQPNSIYRFFGAKFFYSKIQSQFEQLDSQSVNSLGTLLVQQLLSFAQEQNYPNNVCLYVCLSLAALAVQMNQEGVVNQILVWLNPIATLHPKIVLMLLTVLPEEAQNRNIMMTRAHRDSFLSQLEGSSSKILQYLSQIWALTTQDTDRCQIFKCLKNWVEFMDSSSCATPFSIISICFEMLQQSNGDLFDGCVDACISFLRKLRSCAPQNVQHYLFSIIKLHYRWKECIHYFEATPLEDQDNDCLERCFSLCRLFSESSEVLIDEFGIIPTNEQQQLISILLECAAFKWDHNVSRITFKFFYDLSITIKRGNDDQVANEPVVQFYCKLYEMLLDIAVERTKVPEKFLIVNDKLPVEYDDCRMDWREVVLDCVDVLGPSLCMERLCTKINLEINAGEKNWCLIEALLVSIEKLIPRFRCDSSNLFPHLANVIRTLPREFLRLQDTAISILGHYSCWLKSNPDYFESIFKKLMEDLCVKQLSQAASMSMRDIMCECCDINNVPIRGIFEQYKHLLQMNGISSEVELNLLEGIVRVCSAASNADNDAIFIDIVTNIANQLSSLVERTDQSTTKAVCSLIDRLSVLFRSYKNPNSMITRVFIEVYQLLHKLLSTKPNEYTCEKVCRCFKFAIRNCGVALSDYIPTISNNLTEHFSTMTFSAFIYVGSIIVSVFALHNNGIYGKMLENMFDSFTSTFFRNFTSIEHFVIRPDVVEEYYYFVAKILQYSPMLFFDGQSKSNIIIQAAIVGLKLRHREAQKGILLFFERLIDFSSSSKYKHASAIVVNEIGGHLLQALFSLLCGESTAYSIDESNGSISDTMWALKKQFPESFQVSSFIFLPALLTLIVVLIELVAKYSRQPFH